MARATEQEEAEQLVRDAQLLQTLGCFAMVLEKIPAQLGERVAKMLTIPTIGIGAGPHTDGQVLVTQDMLGLTGSIRPKFVKPFADLAGETTSAVRRYIADVQKGEFPDETHSHA